MDALAELLRAVKEGRAGVGDDFLSSFPSRLEMLGAFKSASGKRANARQATEQDVMDRFRQELVHYSPMGRIMVFSSVEQREQADVETLVTLYEMGLKMSRLLEARENAVPDGVGPEFD